MNKILLFFLFIFAICLDAQDTIRVPVLAYWQKGDTFSYQIKKVKHKSSSKVKLDTVRYVGTFKILNESKKSHKISYQASNYNYDFKEIFKDELAPLATIMNMEVIYSTDENGAFQKIENIDEIRKKIKKGSDAMLSQMRKTKEFTPNQSAQIEKVMENLMTEEYIQENAFSEINMFHYLYGFELHNFINQDYEEEIESPLTNQPITTLGNIKVAYINEDTETINVIEEKKMDPEDVNNMVKTFLSKILSDDSEMQKALKNAIYEVNDRTSIIYNYGLSLPEKINYKRDTKVVIQDSNASKTEYLDMNLIQ